MVLPLLSYPVVAVVPGSNVLQVFYRGFDNGLRTLWREPDGTWSAEQDLGGSLNPLGPPAVAYLPTQGQEMQWTEVRGANSYCYCACNSATNAQQGGSHSHTMNIEAGAPYFYAVLTKDDDSVDFPAGAILTIRDPDGTPYDHDTQGENQLLIMAGISVQCLIVKDPKPGNWSLTITVPAGVGFHCECDTLPSKDVYKTITEALSSPTQLLPRDFSDGTSVTGWLGTAAVALVAGSLIALGACPRNK